MLIGLLFIGCSKCPTLPEVSANHVVLTELFSFVECPNCPEAEEAIHTLKSEYGDSLAVLIYHMRTPGDTLSPLDAQVRAEWYGVSGAPTAFFDGVKRVTGAENVYRNYQDEVVKRRRIISPLRMNMDASYTGTNIQIDLSAVALGSLSGNLKLRVVLFQDSVWFEGALYNFVVRRIEEMDFSLVSSDTFKTTYNFSNEWNNGNMGAVGFVQNDDTKEVLQATVKEIALPSLEYGFELVCIDDTSQTIPVDTEAGFKLTLENSGNLNDVYELSLMVVESAPGWFENYCYRGLCLFPPYIGLDTLMAGEVDTTISVHIMPMGNPGSEVVCFKVKSSGDTTLADSVYLYTQADGVKSLHFTFKNLTTTIN